MAIIASPRSPLLRYISADIQYLFAVFFKGELVIDDNGQSPSTIAEGKVAAHMLLRLYDEQPSETRRKILDILAAWEAPLTQHP